MAVPLIQFWEVSKKLRLPKEGRSDICNLKCSQNNPQDDMGIPPETLRFTLLLYGKPEPVSDAPGKAPVTLTKGRCESQPDSLRSHEMEGFLPEIQGNLCQELTVGSCELVLAYRQIAGRDERGREEAIHYCRREI